MWTRRLIRGLQILALCCGELLSCIVVSPRPLMAQDDQMGASYDEQTHSYVRYSAVAGVLQALLDQRPDVLVNKVEQRQTVPLFGHSYSVAHYSEGDTTIAGYECRGFLAWSDMQGLNGVGMNGCLVRGRWRIVAFDPGNGHSFKLLGWMKPATTADLSVPGSWEPTSPWEPTSSLDQSQAIVGASGADVAALAQAGADKKADIDEKIDELRQDIDELQEHIESTQSDIDQLAECSGMGAAICEAGAGRLRRDLNQSRKEMRDKQNEIANLLSEERSSAATANSSGSEGGSGVGSYSGPFSIDVQGLLSRSPSRWSCPKSSREEPSSAPIAPSSLPCMRDKYVWAALEQAYAAECHAELKMESEAEQNAADMAKNLSTAKSMCSNRPAISGGSSCSTMDIYPCN